MAAQVKCPYCGSYNTAKTKNGKVSNALATTGTVIGGALLEMVTGGIGGLLGANAAYGRTWHQYCCHDCHEAFKVKLGAAGNVKEIKKY